MNNQIDRMSKDELVNYMKDMGLIKVYAEYSFKIGNNPIGNLLNASRVYCSDKMNRLGNFVPPKSKPTQTSKLCKKIIGVVNEISNNFAKQVLTQQF